jgi:hypothetical protein
VGMAIGSRRSMALTVQRCGLRDRQPVSRIVAALMVGCNADLGPILISSLTPIQAILSFPDGPKPLWTELAGAKKQRHALWHRLGAEDVLMGLLKSFRRHRNNRRPVVQFEHSPSSSSPPLACPAPVSLDQQRLWTAPKHVLNPLDPGMIALSSRDRRCRQPSGKPAPGPRREEACATAAFSERHPRAALATRGLNNAWLQPASQGITYLKSRYGVVTPDPRYFVIHHQDGLLRIMMRSEFLKAGHQEPRALAW